MTIVITTYLTPLLQKKLETTVQEQTKGIYSLQLHGLDASLLRGRIAADSLHLEPDLEAWERQAAAGKKDSLGRQETPRTLLDLKSGSFAISGVNFMGILRGKPLDATSLRLQKPALIITEMWQDTTQQHEPLHESLQGIAKDLQIKRINFEDGTLRIRQGRKAAADKISLDNFTIEVKDLKLDSASFHQDNRAYYARSMVLESGKAAFLLKDGTYRLQAGALKANTADGTLNIGNLKVIPLLKNAELAKRRGRAVSTLNLEVPEINISGIDYRLHSRYNNLAAKLVVLKEPSLSAYMDKKNFPQKGDKPLPHDFVQELKTGMTLHKLEVQGMHIRYEELAPEASEKGVIRFENMDATITNLTNDKKRMSAKTPAVVEAKASLNGDMPLALTARFDLLDPNAFHTLQGKVGPGNPATLNPILEPTAFMSIKSGKLQQSEVDMQLYRNKASGKLYVRYTDFKVDILSKEEDKRQSLGKKILSKVANKVVIESDNPKEGEELRVGDIQVVRAKHRSVFNYWKDCLMSGFRGAAGVESFGADLENPDRK
jgi:hypothetical protein